MKLIGRAHVQRPYPFPCYLRSENMSHNKEDYVGVPKDDPRWDEAEKEQTQSGIKFAIQVTQVRDECIFSRRLQLHIAKYKTSSGHISTEGKPENPLPDATCILLKVFIPKGGWSCLSCSDYTALRKQSITMHVTENGRPFDAGLHFSQ